MNSTRTHFRGRWLNPGNRQQSDVNVHCGKDAFHVVFLSTWSLQIPAMLPQGQPLWHRPPVPGRGPPQKGGSCVDPHIPVEEIMKFSKHFLTNVWPWSYIGEWFRHRLRLSELHLTLHTRNQFLQQRKFHITTDVRAANKRLHLH